MIGRLAALGLTGALLAGCAHTPEPAPTQCPAPAGELLVKPQRLPAIPPGPLTQGQAIATWLNHIQLYEIQRSRYARLQAWGQTQCAWPTPGR
jgi:hypothetical protein